MGVADHLTSEDLDYLERALALAEKGRGSAGPNPVVGAVVVGRDTAGRSVRLGEGYHAEYGGPHAERAALGECRRRGADPRGATLFVSLEPCVHHGRQPPCTEAIIEAGIARVVIASADPSAKADGRGPRALEAAGIEVESIGGPAVLAGPREVGERARSLAESARLQNQAFRKHSRTGRPLVVLKLAASLDGRVVTRGGESRWITSEESRARGHYWRAELDAIAVGSGTVGADDPELTARPEGRDTLHGRPLRIVFDSAASLPSDSRLLATLDRAPLLLAVGPEAPQERTERLRQRGVEVVELAAGEGGVSVEDALDSLGGRGVTSLLLEGGPSLAGSFVDAAQVDEVRLLTAPLLLGAGRSAVDGVGVEALADAVRGRVELTERVGPDALSIARLHEW